MDKGTDSRMRQAEDGVGFGACSAKHILNGLGSCRHDYRLKCDRD